MRSQPSFLLMQIVDDKRRLLNFNGGASCFEFFLELVCIGFRYAFLNGLRCTFNQVFSFFQAQASDGTYGFNGFNFLFACSFQNNCKFSLFFFWGGSSGRTSRLGPFLSLSPPVSNFVVMAWGVGQNIGHMLLFTARRMGCLAGKTH